MTEREETRDAERRHGTALELRCKQCGTKWDYATDAPTQCPDCLDHLGELIDLDGEGHEHTNPMAAFFCERPACPYYGGGRA